MPANECKEKDRNTKLTGMITLQRIYLGKILDFKKYKDYPGNNWERFFLNSILDDIESMLNVLSAVIVAIRRMFLLLGHRG